MKCRDETPWAYDAQNAEVKGGRHRKVEMNYLDVVPTKK